MAAGFAGEGAHLVLGDLEPTRATLEAAVALARGRGVRAVALTGDVARSTDMTALARELPMTPSGKIQKYQLREAIARKLDLPPVR